MIWNGSRVSIEFRCLNEKDGDVYVLHMDGETYSYNTRFEAEPVDDGLIVTGGLVNGELFVEK